MGDHELRAAERKLCRANKTQRGMLPETPDGAVVGVLHVAVQAATLVLNAGNEVRH